MPGTYIGLAALIEPGRRAVTAAVNRCANDFIAKANPNTPHETGALQASEQTDGAVDKGDTIEATIHTGGEVSAYAGVQEKGTWDSGPNAGAQIVNHPGGGGTHYMERTLNEGEAEWLDEIKRAYEEAY